MDNESEQEIDAEVLNDRFEIVGLLGRGGQGVTYLALDREDDDRQVVAKVLEISVASSWKSIELFEREAATLERLDHPRIPKYVDHFHHSADSAMRFVMVQEFIDGEDLGRRLAAGKTWSLEETWGRLQQIAEILDYLHTLSPPVVHRDIKPSNLILGPGDELYLVDFGASQNIIPATAGGSTIIGTSGYVPMEQYMGRAAPASDIYALGATTLHMLSGVHPADIDLERGQLRYSKYVSDGRMRALLGQMLVHLEDRLADGGALRAALRTTVSPGAADSDPGQALATRAVPWQESFAGNAVELTDPERPWLSIVRSNTSISRKIQIPASWVMITATSSQLLVNRRRRLATLSTASLVVGVLIVGFMLRLPLWIVMIGAIVTIPMIVLHLLSRPSAVKLGAGHWRVDDADGDYAQLARFVADGKTVAAELNTGQLVALPLPELASPERRDYLIEVLNDAREQLASTGEIDITRVR